MASLTMAQVYGLARQAGFDPAQAVIMAAIAMAESGLNPGALGDESLEDATWGPSVGLAQIRTLKRDTGTGRTRDITELTDPLRNLTAAYEISGHGKDFTPWTVYTSGRYRQFLGQAASSGAGYIQGLPVANTGVAFGVPSLAEVSNRARDLTIMGAVVVLGVMLVVGGAARATGVGEGALRGALARRERRPR